MEATAKNILNTDSLQPSRSPNLRLVPNTGNKIPTNNASSAFRNRPDLSLVPPIERQQSSAENSGSPSQNRPGLHLVPPTQNSASQNSTASEMDDTQTATAARYAATLAQDRRMHVQKARPEREGSEQNQTNEVPQNQNRSPQKSRASKNNNRLRDTRRLAKFLRNPVTQTLTLFGQIQLMDILFIFPFLIAILKDIIDLVVGLIPGIGTVFTLMCSILIFLCSLFIGVSMFFLARGKRKQLKSLFSLFIKGALLMGGTAATEMIPGIDLLPLETVSIIIVYIMVLKERRDNDDSGTMEYN